MSMALLFGCLSLVTIHDRTHVRDRLEWAASKLPLLLDQQTAERLAASLETIEAPSPCDAGQPGCGTEPAAAPPPDAVGSPSSRSRTRSGRGDSHRLVRHQAGVRRHRRKLRWLGLSTIGGPKAR